MYQTIKERVLGYFPVASPNERPRSKPVLIGFDRPGDVVSPAAVHLGSQAHRWSDSRHQPPHSGAHYRATARPFSSSIEGSLPASRHRVSDGSSTPTSAAVCRGQAFHDAQDRGIPYTRCSSMDGMPRNGPQSNSKVNLRRRFSSSPAVSQCRDGRGGAHSSPPSPEPPSFSPADIQKRFKLALQADPVDIAGLRQMCWHGCPLFWRYEVWMYVTGNWSSQRGMQATTLSRRCVEYAGYIHTTYGLVDWDAVCALLDSGVNTAVNRSKLKWMETNSSSVTPVETSLSASGNGLSSGTANAAQVSITSASLIMVMSSKQDVAQPSTPDHAAGSTVAVKGVEAESEKATEPPSFVLKSTEECLLNSMFGSSQSDSRPPPVMRGTPRGSSATSLQSTTAASQVSVSSMLGSKELQTLKQIRKDIPRMSGGVFYLKHPRVQTSIERILFIWSLRHPACGYVQGMNDLIIPFMGVVLAYRFCPTRSVTELRSYSTEILNEMWSADVVSSMQWINSVEADVYWLISYLLNTIQDNYTSGHAGITTMVGELEAVIEAADPPLYEYLVDVLQLRFEQFTFRWMNCLLMRELTDTQALRLLDSYLSDEERRWSATHVYVCAALLLRWGPQLLQMEGDYISALRFLQSPPTDKISLRDMQDILSEGYVLQNLYESLLARLPNSAA